MSNITSKIKKIKILLTDVDGVLTDGGMYYSSKGDVMKKFHARDGMAISLLKRNDIPTILVTKEKTMIVKQWAKKMNVAKLYDGIQQKELMVDTICSEYKVKPEELAYIGDDVNDIELLKMVGFSATPADGDYEVKNIVDYVCQQNGGLGAFREIVDLIISSQFHNKKRY